MTKPESPAPDPIPLLDLARQHAPIADRLTEAIGSVVERQAFVLGRTVAEFEAAVADYLKVEHAVGVGNGTDALYLSVRLLDPGPGDEVITSPFTFFGTAGAIANAGARPVFVDIEPATFNLDPEAAAAAITERTRAIVPVHLYGQMAEMDPLLELARQHDLWVIEDAAQAIGARAVVDDEWRRAGTLGRLGCFSFYPTKNLGGWGDGGLITTGDAELASRLRALREHGQDRQIGSYYHREVGTNSRLDALQAAVLRVKLEQLPGWTEGRRARAAFYDQRLADLGPVSPPITGSDRFHVYNLYTIRTERRDELRDFLAGRGIGTGIYYPLPLHLQPCFEELGYERGDFPEAERASQEVLSLPVFPELAPEEQERIVAAIRAFFGG